VHAYTRSDACGSASAWASLLGKYKQDSLKGTGVYGDPGLLQAVKRDPIGIGYVNLSYLFNGNTVTPGVVIVPIDAKSTGAIGPQDRIDSRAKAFTAIASGQYPGARREFFVTKGKPNRLAAEFIKYVLSDDGLKVLDQVGGYVPLTKAERAAQIAKTK
jgi:phosphate transport system substrate-binding protein